MAPRGAGRQTDVMTLLSSHRFELFTTEHAALVAGFLVVAVVLVAVGRRHRGSPAERRFRRTLAILIPCVLVPLQIPQLLPGDFDAGTSLPLQLCDLAWPAAVWALWTRAPLPTALVYFWGLTLTVQGIVTPSLGETFPDPRYFMFWAMHFLIVWTAVYLAFGLGGPITWRSFRLAVGATLVWAATVMVVNGLAGTNYGYLNRKPSGGSVLDALPAWPWYVVVQVVVVFSVWALMTWPWTRAKRRTPGRETVGVSQR